MLARRSKATSVRAAPKKFAKDVATELDRRQQRRHWRRRALVAGGVVTVVILALLYLRFGRGSGAAGSTATGPHRCAIRISPAGITVDGQSVTRDQAVAACVAAGNGADVTVTGDTREGDWQDLLAALMAAGVPVGIHQ